MGRIFLGVEADARAQALGVPGGTGPLISAVGEGAAGARTATRHHPPAYRGVRMWGDTHYSLVNSLGNGFASIRLGGLDLVADRRIGLALLVTAGTAAAGDPDSVPQVRYERGTVIKGLINWALPTLFDPVEPPEYNLWFLLHHLGEFQVSAELSLPAAITEDGFVGDWDERIILPTIDLGGTPPPERKPRPAPVPIEVPVSRRSA